ncbi:MotA/TolQ/ExbB proton channel family protein [Roseovarius sp. S1116L3]|uniref:MotA/TolQ/ExbB proton channel family protein n=1 Tax=Roseovarius roseus TaxID=3342636 RepID=UPI00372C4F27
MSNSKRPSDRAWGRALRMACACAALALLPCGAALAQEAETGGTSPGSSQPAPSLQVEAPTAPSAAAEDHSGHSGMAPAPEAPVMPEAAEPAITAQTAPASGASDALTFLQRGGPAIWSISALSVVALALILWKTWRLAMMGAWSGGRRVQRAVAIWTEGREAEALADLEGRRTCRAALVRTAMAARRDGTLDDAGARAETERVARGLIARARDGLRPLELIAAIAPLLGLLGTVLGMIAAFQALQEAGSRADPAILAGGIWEALLTTAAGMAVAIPASMALAWFESVVDRLRSEMEDAATRIFLRPTAQDTPLARAAE